MGTINFVLVGARNSGKTCYLSMLLSDCPGIATNDASTTEYLKQQRQNLTAGELPAATASMLRELKFNYHNEQHSVTFSFDDYDGSFVESLSRRDTEDEVSRTALKLRMQESEGLFFFFPYVTQQDEQVLTNFAAEINTIIGLLKEATEGRYTKLPFPTCICVTKWDQSPHYKASDEGQQARQYVESISVYRQAKEKIEQFFESVQVIPISAFGGSEDGYHPITGATPYQLEVPIKDCLDKLFVRYVQRIQAFQEQQDQIGLLSYLYSLYEDFQHYEGGKYCRLYDDLEQRLSDQLLETVRKQKLEQLAPEQKSIYTCLRRSDLRLAIDQERKTHTGARRNRRFRRQVAGALMVIMLGLGLGYYTLHSQEQSQLKKIVLSIKLERPPVELLTQSTRFVQAWSRPYQLPIGGIFAKDRTMIVSQVEAVVRPYFAELIEQVKNAQEPVPSTVTEILTIAQATEAWPDIDFASRIQSQAKTLEHAFTVFQRVRQILAEPDRYASMADRHLIADLETTAYAWPALKNMGPELELKMTQQLNDLTEQYAQLRHDISNAPPDPESEAKLQALVATTAKMADDNELKSQILNLSETALTSKETLSALRTLAERPQMEYEDYIQLRIPESDSIFAWQVIDETRNQIEKKLVEQVLTDSNSIVQNRSERVLEESLSSLQLMTNWGYPEVNIMIDTLQTQINSVQREQSLGMMLKNIAQTQKIDKMHDAIKEYWRVDYAIEEKKRIEDILQSQFEGLERKELPKTDQIDTMPDVSHIRKVIKELENTTNQVLTAVLGQDKFSFRYKRPIDLVSRFKRLKSKIANIEEALENGVSVRVTFSAAEDNDTLGFKCSYSNDNLEITFEPEKITLPNDSELRYPCSTTPEGEAQMSWKRPIRLKKGRNYRVTVTEHDIINSDIWSTPFTLDLDEIIALANGRTIDKTFHPYKISFGRA